MVLIKNVLKSFIKAFRVDTVYAHCDIPCGIYDPHLAQIAAHTVIRMDALISELAQPGGGASDSERAAYVNKLARFVAVKEEHAELAKRELRILWGDYFKPEHLEQFPALHELFWNAMKAASSARQDTNMDSAQSLLKATQEISDIFWRTKGANPVRHPSRQTSGGELVYPS